MNECTESRFLSDVDNHQMMVIRDSGVDRHIRFRKPGTICYGFDLITWAGHLCITGDCGTYVFTRIKDMFEFFRAGPVDALLHPGRKLFINTGYWGEKLLSIDSTGGYRKFAQEEFEERVWRHFNNYWENEERDEADKDACRGAVENLIAITADDEQEAYAAVHAFSHGGFIFQDFFDGGGTERHTFHYLWCLYGIVWGIAQYDSRGSVDPST